MNDTEIQLIAVRDLLPNPFRNIADYEIHEEKVAQLIASFNSTGVWPTIVARPAAKNGHAEIAFGHHRREALRRRHKEDLTYKVNVNVVPLSDEKMLKMMAAENQEEFHSSFFVTIETVEAVIKAAAEGKITLREKPTSSAGVRAIIIAKFLGWLNPDGTAQHKVEWALRALCFIREGILARDDFRGLSEVQAHNLLISTDAAQSAHQFHEGIAEPLKALEKQEAKLSYDVTRGRPGAEKSLTEVRKQKQALAPKVERAKARTAATMKKVVEKVKAGEVATKGIREAVAKELSGKRFKGIPEVEKFVHDLCHNLWHVLNEQDKDRMAKVEAVIANKTDVGESRVRAVKSHLEAIAGRALGLAARLGPLAPKLVEVQKLLANREFEE